MEVLPRTPAAEAAARQLMETLGELPEGRMFGVLVCADGTVLKAGSGAWGGEGWAPPLVVRPELPDERATVARLEAIRQELEGLAPDPELAAAEERWRGARERFNTRLRLAKGLRDMRRETERAEDLEKESRHDKHEKRHFRAREQAELEPLRAADRQREERRLALVRERRQLSRDLQAQMHAQFFPFQGEAWSLASLFPQGPPTGAGECCAPKLLHQAAVLGLQPVGLAEFWWGPPKRDREPGHFYAACEERCGPLLGPLLAGRQPLRILYEDGEMVAVDKPAGVLSVPGRAAWNRDSVLTRLGAEVLPVHRLDLETSGVLLFARTAEAQRRLQRAFARREVGKVYEAVLTGSPSRQEGEIDFPLGPAGGGRYRPDPAGKPALTHFRVLSGPRVELHPVTGRSHQLRVHCLHGLGHPIVGDALYGTPGPRLLLHCRQVQVAGLTVTSPTPF